MSERKRFRREKNVFCQERRRKVRSDSHPSFKFKTQLDGLKILSRICQALNLDRNESVEVLLRIYRWQNSPRWIEKSIKNLSRRQRAKKFGSMDRRSCQDSIEKKPRNLDGLDRKSTRLNSSHVLRSRMPSSA